MDLTAPNVELAQDLYAYAFAHHSYAMMWMAVYLVAKLAARLLWGRGLDSNQISRKIWDPVCLFHNFLSVGIGFYAAYGWESSPSDACGGISDPAQVVILLQATHSISDFIVFFPEMWGEPIFMFHHAVLIVVSVVLPKCPGCFWTVIAFTIGEGGSASIGVDSEWRKHGGESRGLKRVVVFGASRVVNLVLLYQIWLVTPTTHVFALNDQESGALIFKMNVPICMITAIGGSTMMLIVNGVTWFRMWGAYSKLKVKRLAKKKKEKAKRT